MKDKEDNLKDFTYKSLAGAALELITVGCSAGVLNFVYKNAFIDEFGALLGCLGVAALGAGVGYVYLTTVLAEPYAKLVNNELNKQQ